MRSSYSQNNTYIQCPKHWWWSYKQKLVAPEQGASLAFGSAIDNAVMALLEKNPNYLDIFEKDMQVQFAFGKKTVVFDNPDIVYSHNDFDKDILEAEDIVQMMTWATDLNLGNRIKAGLVLYGSNATYSEDLREEILKLFAKIAKTKKNPYKKLSDAEKTFFNRCSWLSLRRKGYILIDSFKQQFLPKVKNVLATQKRVSIKDQATGHSMAGFIDMVLEIDGYDKPVIFDLKTAARPYTQEQIDLTPQLTLYAGMAHGEYNTDLVGYVVLCKNINKNRVNVCQKCGHIKDGRHATCNAIDAQGNRCHGQWDETLKIEPEVQVLVEKKSQQQIASLFGDIGNILVAMENEIVYKDTSKCNSWYGSKCPYFNACHNNDTSGLVKK